jgi:hypothetical protein
MNTIKKARIGRPIAAILLTLALISSAAAKSQVLFVGFIQGQETDVLQGNPPQGIMVDGNVSGVATHFGRLTMTYKVAVTLPPPTSTDPASSTGSAQLLPPREQTTKNLAKIFTRHLTRPSAA